MCTDTPEHCDINSCNDCRHAPSLKLRARIAQHVQTKQLRKQHGEHKFPAHRHGQRKIAPQEILPGIAAIPGMKKPTVTLSNAL